jgi:hypothetical protein
MLQSALFKPGDGRLPALDDAQPCGVNVTELELRPGVSGSAGPCEPLYGFSFIHSHSLGTLQIAHADV